MDQTRLTARLINYLRKIKLHNAWHTEGGKDMNELKITDNKIEERDFLKKNLITSDGFQKNP